MLMISQAVLQEFGSSSNEFEPMALHFPSNKCLIGELAIRERAASASGAANAAASWICPARSHGIGSQIHRPPITELFLTYSHSPPSGHPLSPTNTPMPVNREVDLQCTLLSPQLSLP